MTSETGRRLQIWLSDHLIMLWNVIMYMRPANDPDYRLRPRLVLRLWRRATRA